MDNRYVLFSPIGTTDPISHYHDGAMLHIARSYQPERVYLYLSSEMLALQSSDDRYRESLRLLGARLGRRFETVLYERPELISVHLFDRFYDEFEKILNDIAASNPDCTVLLNVSSGTPAMKGALQTLAALYGTEVFLPVQVSTPVSGANPRRDDFREYSLDAEWECNQDNAAQFKNRCEVSTTLNLSLRLKKEILARHVQAGDYHAALCVAHDIEPYVPHEALCLLEAANARVQLDAAGITKALAGTGRKIIPVEDSSFRNMAEYLLWLGHKNERAEYADFIRGITPLVADLFELYIRRNLGLDLWRYCRPCDKNKKLLLRRAKLEQDEKGRQILKALDDAYTYGYDERPCSSEHMLAIIGAFGNVPECLKELRSVEEACRNIAAHEIVSVTKDWVRKECKLTPEDILKLLFDAADMCGISRVKLKNSYQKMNADILEAFGCLQ